MAKLTGLSFFSGALGLDMGLEQAGIESLSYNEIEATFASTIRANRPDTCLYNGDIRDLTAEKLLSDHGLAKGDLFVMAGGPPCQAFSTAGRRKGLDDDRGNVFLHFLELIGGVMPKYVVIENVRGLLSTPLQHVPHRDRVEGNPVLANSMPGGALARIIEILEHKGYTVTFNLYNTANYGVPQSRERVVMICSREGHRVPYLCPTHTEKASDELQPWVTFRDAAKNVAEVGPCATYSERRLAYFRMLGPGQYWKHLPKELHQEALGMAYFAQGGRVGFYRRIAWDRPSPTLVTCPTMPATDLAHPEEDRPLSVNEYKAIQTFPSDYEVMGKLGDQYRQLGNAVPVHFGKVIGQHLIDFDKGVEIPVRSNAVTSRYKETDDLAWRASLARRMRDLDPVQPSLLEELVAVP